MKAYLLVTNTGTKTYRNPPDSICVLVAQFAESIHPDHPMKDRAILWELPHPEYLNQIIAMKTDEESWQAKVEIPEEIINYLNQEFKKSARDYPE